MLLFKFLAAVMTLAAAPVPKTDPLPPITEAMWTASADNLRTLGLALHNYHDLHSQFPQNVVDANGKVLLSWRVQLLPYLEEDELFKQFRMNEAWDSDHNKKLIEKMPKAFAPVRVKGDAGHTYYQGFVGDDTVFRTKKAVRVSSIVDGCSNTAMLVEASKPVPWTKPDDLPFDATKELPALGAFFDGSFNMLLADGSVSRVKKGFNMSVMKSVIQMSDGQVVDVDALGK